MKLGVCLKCDEIILNISETSIGVNGKNEFGAKLLANFNK